MEDTISTIFQGALHRQIVWYIFKIEKFSFTGISLDFENNFKLDYISNTIMFVSGMYIEKKKL